VVHLYWVLFFDFLAIEVYSFVFSLFEEIMLSLECVGLIAEHSLTLFAKIIHTSLLFMIFHEEITEIINKSLYIFIELYIICVF